MYRKAGWGLTPFIAGYIEPDFYITSSGANIVDKDLKEIRKRGIDRTIAGAIVRELNPQSYKITLDIEGDICVFSKMDFPGKYYVITSVDEAPDGLVIRSVSIQRAWKKRLPLQGISIRIIVSMFRHFRMLWMSILPQAAVPKVWGLKFCGIFCMEMQ